MHRRTLLAAVGSTVGTGLAGCTVGLESIADGDDTTRPGGDPDAATYALGETVAVEGVGDVRVESVAVQRSVIDYLVWRDLHEPADGQLLVVDAAVEAEAVPDLSFHPRLDGERVDPEMRIAFQGRPTRYGVSVPVTGVQSAGVVLEAGDRPVWTLPAGTREELATAPEFHLRDAVVGGTDGDAVLELTVENRGGRDGTFRAVVAAASVHDYDAAVRFPVPAGETVTEPVRNEIVAKADPGAPFTHEVDPDVRRFEIAGT